MRVALCVMGVEVLALEVGTAPLEVLEVAEPEYLAVGFAAAELSEER